MTERSWEQQIENRGWTDAKGSDEMCAYLSGRQGARREKGADAIVKKEGENTHSETWKMPKTNFLDFLICLRAGPLGTFISFIINYSWVNIRHVFKSPWVVLGVFI